MNGSAIFRIVLGLVAIVGGLTGKLALRGTQSGTALAVLGGVFVFLGVVQIARTKKS